MDNYIKIMEHLNQAIGWCSENEQLKNSLTELMKTVAKEFLVELEKEN